MPTGYTAEVGEGISFDQFVWQCARAFGALVMMRDDPANARVPERFEPSDWNAKQLAVAKDRLATLQVMSPEAARINAKAEYDAAVKAREERIASKQALSDKYHAMLAKVVQWEVPSPEHQGLKDFMAEQLRQSIDFDCSMEYDAAPLLLPGDAWLTKAIAGAQREVDHHAKAHAEEVERTEGRNRWLADLRKSVPQPL
jgi:hypothetical protein